MGEITAIAIRRRIWLSVVLGSSALGAAPILAQVVPRDSAGRLGGIVFDSVAMAPAAGAIVELAPRGRVAPEISTTADGRGRFEFADLRPGPYALSFFHASFDSLNIELPPVIVDIRSGGRTRVDLAVPSPRSIASALCAASSTDSVGAIIGLLLDARTGRPLESGLITVSWTEVVGGETDGPRFVPKRARAPINRTGSFVLCGAGRASDVTLVGSTESDTSGKVLVRLPDHGLLRLDIVIGGTLNVMGTVLTDTGPPVVNAEVKLGGGNRTARTDSAGAFQILAVPAGTQTLEARAIGHLPERRMVTFRAGRDTSVEIRLTSLRNLMDTIRVVAEAVDWASRVGFLQRQRTGIGHHFNRESIQRREPFDVYDMLQGIPGVYVSGSAFSRRVVMAARPGFCIPSVHVDGVRLPVTMIGELEGFVPVEAIVGIEVYSSAVGMPVEFANLSRASCGAIAIWTDRMSTGK